MTNEYKLYKHVAFFFKHKIAFKNDRTKARNKKKGIDSFLPGNCVKIRYYVRIIAIKIVCLVLDVPSRLTSTIGERLRTDCPCSRSLTAF